MLPPLPSVATEAPAVRPMGPPAPVAPPPLAPAVRAMAPPVLVPLEAEAVRLIPPPVPVPPGAPPLRLMAPPAAVPTTQWAGRIDGATNEQTVLILRTYPDLNIPAAEGAERNLVRFRIRRTAPSRTQDYYEWQANELLPALREAGITGFRVGRVILGGSSQTWVSGADVDSWASMINNVLAESMGERRMAQMLARGAEMLVHTEDLVMAYRPDLGYMNEQLLTQNQ